MKRCALHGLSVFYGPCSGRIEWHHVWEYAGRQINEKWAIVGACHEHHEGVKRDRKVKDAFERHSLAMLTAEEASKYPKKNWKQIIQSHL